VRVLLSDGSGLASRQAATILSRSGHEVEVLAGESLPLTRLTRHVRNLHRVPAYGIDPWAWLDAALGVLRAGRFEVLLPTQEQVPILAREADAVRATGTDIAVPPWDGLVRVQDKAAAYMTLAELDLPQPRTVVVDGPAEVTGVDDLPVFVKAPVGTASNAVTRVETRPDLEAAVGAVGGPAVVQWPADGPLAMVQAVFRDGELLAWHANLRVREGLSGGASHKLSVRPAAVEGHLERLGQELAWHGALSLDAILEHGDPRYIDVNPRLVEPGNAYFAGLDLPELMLRVSLGERVERPAAPREGVRTHQLLLALLGEASARGRRGVAREIATAAAGRGLYRDSDEELTPAGGDPIAASATVGVGAALLVWPGLWRPLSGGAVGAYALTPEAWRAIRAGRDAG
jgi:hypothetical protein